jgi:hypothetical protein
LQSRYFPIQNLLACSSDALAQRFVFLGHAYPNTHAQGSLYQLRFPCPLCLSRACILFSDLCWVPLSTCNQCQKFNLSLFSLFISLNLAFISAVRLDEISHSGQLILGALFFKHVFGGHGAAKILVVLSCMG